ncbi:MAG: hypothetical protein ACI9X4_002192, partial [Glaciecola sp.]
LHPSGEQPTRSPVLWYGALFYVLLIVTASVGVQSP